MDVRLTQVRGMKRHQQQGGCGESLAFNAALGQARLRRSGPSRESWGLSSDEEDDCGDQLDCGEIVSRELILSRRNAAEVFNLVKETLDEISLAIERTFALMLAIGLGWDDGSRSLLSEFVDEGISILGLIGDDCAWVGIFQQWSSASKIVVLPRRQHQGARIA